MSRRRLHVAASRLPRLLAFAAGVQVLLWFGSGLALALAPIERVRGEHPVDRTLALLPPGRTA